MYQKIYPKPISVKCYEGKFTFKKEVTLEISKDFKMEESLLLMAELWKNFTCGICKLNIKRTERTDDFLWIIGDPQKTNKEDEYTYGVYIDENGISIKGDDDLSLIHGFYTLLQIVRPINFHQGEECFAVNCGHIEDAPDISFRCMHLSVKIDSDMHVFRKLLRFAAFMKYSHVIIEFNGSLKYECLNELSWPGAFCKNEIKPILDEARYLGLELIPLFNSLGHAGMGSLMNCKNVMLDQNPRLALLFEPTGWSFCISNPETISLIRAASDELVDLLGPGSYFHMGLDEALDFATCDICAEKDKGDLLAGFVNDMAEYIRKKGRRTIVWGDMLLARKQFDPEFTYRTQKHFSVANATDEVPTHEALPKIDRDVIIADWQYYIDTKENPTAAYISSLGFDVIPASYNDFKNIQIIAENAGINNYFGYMSTSWGDEKTNADLMLYSADMAWSGKNAGKIDSFRLEERFYAAGNIQRKLLPTSVTFQTAGWF